MSASTRLSRIALTLAFAPAVSLCTSCQYTGPFVEIKTRVEIAVHATPSTSIYSAGPSSTLGDYRFTSFSGTATCRMQGGEEFGIASESDSIAARTLVERHAVDELRLTRAADGGMRLERKGYQACGLVFLDGDWADYEAGREVLLGLDVKGWSAWHHATQDAFRDLIDARRAPLSKRWIAEGRSASATVVRDFEIDAQPRIRADRRKLTIYVESLRLHGSFAVLSRFKDDSFLWWPSSYSLRPGVAQFFAGFGAVMARVTVEVGIRLLAGCGRVLCHCH